MNLPEFQDLDLSIARARIALSLIAMLSLYVDPSTAGGLSPPPRGTDVERN